MKENEETLKKMGYGKKIDNIPLLLEDGVINPYWVFYNEVTVGFPRDASIWCLEEKGLQWTCWHEAWLLHFDIDQMRKSGATEKRISEKKKLFLESSYGREHLEILRKLDE